MTGPRAAEASARCHSSPWRTWRRPCRWCARSCRRRRSMPGRCWPSATGAQVWVKHENHTPIGAFKVRGGIVYLDALKRREAKLNGVVTATRGNHGQSIALAAARAACPARSSCRTGTRARRMRPCRPSARSWSSPAPTSMNAGRTPRGLAEERGYHFVPVVPCGPGEGRGDLRAGAVPGRVRPRCGLRADRHGLGHLRPHHGARSAGAQDGHRRRRGRQRAGRCPVLRAGATRCRPTRRPPSPMAWPAAIPLPSRSRSSAGVRRASCA